MQVKFVARVSGVQERSHYYPQTGTYVISTLKLMENELDVTGNIEVRENLPLGSVWSVIVDTTTPNVTTKEPTTERLELPMEVASK